MKETTVFGEKIRDERGKERPNIVFGVMLILAGLVLMAIKSGALSEEIWSIIWSYWPIVIILLGVQVMLGGNKFSRVFVSLLTVLVLVSIVVIGIKETRPELIEQLGLNRLPWYNYLDLIKINK